MMITHKAPIICKLRSYISYSPSAVLTKCFLGLHTRSKHCIDCDRNSEEVIHNALLRGIEEGLKDD